MTHFFILMNTTYQYISDEFVWIAHTFSLHTLIMSLNWPTFTEKILGICPQNLPHLFRSWTRL